MVGSSETNQQLIWADNQVAPEGSESLGPSQVPHHRTFADNLGSVEAPKRGMWWKPAVFALVVAVRTWDLMSRGGSKLETVTATVK